MSITQGFTAVVSKSVTGYIVIPCSNKASSVYKKRSTVVVAKTVIGFIVLPCSNKALSVYNTRNYCGCV